MVKMFTTEELNALADFYGSTAGQSAMKKMPEYFAEIFPFLRQMLEASGQRATLGRPTQSVAPSSAK